MEIMIPAWIDGKLSPVEKLDVHLRGLRHQAVSVFVIWNDQILLQRRALEKYHTPGLWANACCTHPMWGEGSDECAVRRVQEELGFRISDPEFRKTLEYRADVGNGMIEHEVVDVFVVKMQNPPQIRLNPDEVMEYQWLSFSKLKEKIARSPETFTPWLRIYMADHADSIFGIDFAGEDPL